MRKRHLLIGIIIIVLASYYAFKNVSIVELGRAFMAVRYEYLIPMLFIISLTFLFRAIRWRYLVRSVKDVKTTHLFSPLMVGFMGNMLPARAGEFIRAYLLGKKENMSFSASFATIFVERLLDLGMVILLLLWVLFFQADAFSYGDTGENHKLMTYMLHFGRVSFIGFVLIFLFVALLQYKNAWAMKIVELFIKPLPHNWGEKIKKLTHSFTEGLGILKDKRGFLASLFYSVLVWVAIVLSYYPLLIAFGIDSELPALSSTVIICLAVVVFITLFPTPGFLGSFQAGCVVALHEIFLIPKAVAASFGIIAWLANMGFIIAIGAIFVLRDHISLGELAAKRESVE
jgi:uncharacterized protein (TIRG00374 family)